MVLNKIILTIMSIKEMQGLMTEPWETPQIKDGGEEAKTSKRQREHPLNARQKKSRTRWSTVLILFFVTQLFRPWSTKRNVI
jgi:hypothetical protein